MERPSFDLTDVASLLEHRFERLGDGFGHVLAAWRTVVGPEMTRFAMPTSLANGELRVRCADASWTSEVLHQAPELLARLRRELGEQAPRRIVPKTGRMPEAVAESTPPPPQLPDLDARESATIRATVEQLPAGPLRSSVEHAMTRARQAAKLREQG